MRYLVDVEAWKNFDKFYSDFFVEPCNARLGLISDDVNPFRIMSISQNTWSIMMVVYNLLPWLYMKPEYAMLCST